MILFPPKKKITLANISAKIRKLLSAQPTLQSTGAVSAEFYHSIKSSSKEEFLTPLHLSFMIYGDKNYLIRVVTTFRLSKERRSDWKLYGIEKEATLRLYRLFFDDNNAAIFFVSLVFFNFWQTILLQKYSADSSRRYVRTQHSWWNKYISSRFTQFHKNKNSHTF